MNQSINQSAYNSQWEDTDSYWPHVLAGCPTITEQLPATYGWIQQLIAETSLDLTIFTVADAFARLFGIVCALLEANPEAAGFDDSS